MFSSPHHIILRLAGGHDGGSVLFCTQRKVIKPLQWHHNGHDGVSNHQPHDCLLNRSCRCTSKKTSKLCITRLCAWNSPAQRSSNAENVSIWWRHLSGHDGGSVLFCTHKKVIKLTMLTIFNSYNVGIARIIFISCIIFITRIILRACIIFITPGVPKDLVISKNIILMA